MRGQESKNIVKKGDFKSVYVTSYDFQLKQVQRDDKTCLNSSSHLATLHTLSCVTEAVVPTKTPGSKGSRRAAHFKTLQNSLTQLSAQQKQRVSALFAQGMLGTGNIMRCNSHVQSASSPIPRLKGSRFLSLMMLIPSFCLFSIKWNILHFLVINYTETYPMAPRGITSCI